MAEAKWIYQESERWKDARGFTRVLYTVGYYDENGQWEPESDYEDEVEAADRVRYLNGADNIDKQKLIKWLKQEQSACQARGETERENAAGELLLKIERGYFDVERED